MQIKTFSPIVPLTPYVRIFMGLQGVFPPTEPKHITPKGEGALFFPFYAPSLYSQFVVSDIIKTDMRFGLDKPMLLGQSNTYAKFNWNGMVNLIIVPLTPTGLYHFLREGAQSVTNAAYSMDFLNLPAYFNTLQEQLWEIDNAPEAQLLIERCLLKHFLPAMERPLPTMIDPIINMVNLHDGVLRIDTLAHKFKVSTRRLEQQFSTQVGISPKEYARVIRFRAMMKQMYQFPTTNWMQMVSDFKLHDQSHLIREFRQYAGMTPTLLSEDRPLFDQLAYRNAFE